MPDDVIVMLTLTLKPDAFAPFVEGLPQMFAETRAHKGFQSVSVHRSAENPHKLVIIEGWDNVQDQQNYIGWRTERGDMAAIGAALAEPPQIAIWEKQAIAQV